MLNSINPYVAGNPVGGEDCFVGRTDVLRDVRKVLENPKENAIVLYGQRRIGKTSILQELDEQLSKEEQYVPISFDLQDKAAWSLGEVLADLAREISYRLQLPEPNDLDFNQNNTFREVFLQQVLETLPNSCSLVLLFDEFDVLDNPSPNQAGKDFFPYLRDLMSMDRARLKFIFVIGRKPEDQPFQGVSDET
jgi:AAA+ ATPase superfamily predicted ATPase